MVVAVEPAATGQSLPASFAATRLAADPASKGVGDVGGAQGRRRGRGVERGRDVSAALVFDPPTRLGRRGSPHPTRVRESVPVLHPR